jgi:squalene synthase HpnC
LEDTFLHEAGGLSGLCLEPGWAIREFPLANPREPKGFPYLSQKSYNGAARKNNSCMTNPEATIRGAYAECRRRARRHYENFPVASLLLPRAKRDALAAIYAFARYADDLADEPGVEGRLARLAEWRERLGQCYVGEHLYGAPEGGPQGPSPTEAPAGGPQAPSPTEPQIGHPVFIALRDTINRFQLSQEHFENLLRAFEQDVVENRHADFASLLAYCRCSANPVGRLVLELFGHRDPELFALSDHICTALQLTNFWQDVAVDLERDRIYLPLDDLRRFNYSLDDLQTRRADERWRQLIAFEISRTRELFEKGKSLPERVLPELRRQLRLTWLGGMTILTKIESVGYDVFRRRPTLSRWDFVRLYFKARHRL